MRAYPVVSKLVAVLCGIAIAPIALGSDQVQTDRVAGERGFAEMQNEAWAGERDGLLNIVHEPNSPIDTPEGETGTPHADKALHQESRDRAEQGAGEATAREIRMMLGTHPKSRRGLKLALPVLPSLEKPGGVRSFPNSPSTASLVSPARGWRVLDFGEQKPDYGTPSMGISIRTRDHAQVVAPFDGKIKYAGEFSSYGRILIIEHGKKHYTLLVGLDHIDSVAGQWVLAGEPIGRMGTAANGKSTLYFELRQTGQPIDPRPWLAKMEHDSFGDGVTDPSVRPEEYFVQVTRLSKEYDKLSRDLVMLTTKRDKLIARMTKLTAKQAALTTLVAELSRDNEDLSKQLDQLAHRGDDPPSNDIELTR